MKEYRYSIRKNTHAVSIVTFGTGLYSGKLGQTVQEGGVEKLDLEVEATIVQSIFKEILGDKEVPEGEILSYSETLKGPT